jgi:uroporphyrinogen decarboxylase
MTSTLAKPTTGAERLLAACRGGRADATPVWFMRQAGRSLAAYRSLREQYPILTLAKTPELCARVTLMPVDELGVDGAVMFADIMLPLEGMGVSLEIQPDLGPVIHQPIRARADVERLRPLEPARDVPFLLDAIRLVRQELGDGRAGLIGFGGAPYTLACYLIEGRPARDYALAKSLMLREPDVWAALMDRLTDATIAYLTAQVAAGAQVIQLFDSWVGALSPDDFATHVLPWSRRIFGALRGLAPTIYFGTGNASLLELMAEAGSDLVSLDWRVRLDDAWARVGFERGVQGNLDPVRPLAGWEPTVSATDDVLRRADGRPGHVFNLGHGVMPETDPDVLRRLVDYVHEQTADRRP